MDYQQAISYLFSRLPMYQREGKAAYKADISNIISASEILGNPQNNFKSIHVAGTNGKGSVSHMLASILYEAGFKVGLYTSPHLKDFRERIKINGKMIAKNKVIQFVVNRKIAFEKIGLSFFEFTVALAFYHFSKEEVDIAIIETGLGGRLDSTNIINPELSIITNIGLDHTNLLGNTIENISKEKGGIIKENTPVIIGRIQDESKNIFQNIADKKNATLQYASNHNYISDLKGIYQIENINTAVTAILEIQKKGWQINKENISKGLSNTTKNTGILGRWQILDKDPTTICDTAHNEDGIREVFKQIKITPHNNLHVVFGLVNDKNFDKILDLLPKDAKYYFCKPEVIRGLDENVLKSLANKKSLNGNVYTSVQKAFKAAKNKAKKKDLIFIGGSIFIVSEIV